MSLEMKYETIHQVMENWEELRRIKDHEELAGVTLFKHMFEKCPASKELFGFKADMDPHCPSIKASKRYVTHAKYFVQMLDKSLQMLGPDAELLEEILVDLGAKHVALGVKIEFFDAMRDSLMATLQDILGENFAEAEESWKQVFDALSSTMIEAMQKKLDEKAL